MAAGVLRPGFVRVWANLGVGRLLPQRWNDVRSDEPMLPAWREARLVADVDHLGRHAPEELRQVCCGG